MKRFSLQKMLYLFMAVSALLTICAGGYMSMTYRRDLLAQNEEYAHQRLEDIANRLESQLGVIATNVENLAQKPSLLNFAQMDPVSKYKYSEFVRTLLDSYAETEPSIQGIYLASLDGAVLRGHANSMDERDYGILMAYRWVEKRCALDQPFRETQYVRVYDLGTKSRRQNDAYLYAIVVPVYNMTYCGSMVTLIDVSILMEGVAGLSEEVSMLCEGEPMWYSNGRRPGGEGPEAQEDRTYSRVLSRAPWEIRVSLDQSEVYQRVMKNVQNNATLVLLIILVEGGMLILIYHGIVLPIQNVISQMTPVGQQNDMVIHPISNQHKSRNEIEQLTSGINGMLERVEELNRRANQSQIDSLNGQIMFLQSQINPHFLFNSLSCIRGMAAEGRFEEIRGMTESIAQIYRYCMEDDVMSVVSREIESIQWYVNTFDIRYGEMAHVEYALEPQAGECAVPRMILQPLVENAFLHGFVGKKPSGGLLRIAGQVEEGWVRIEVENSGAPLDDAAVERMNSADSGMRKHRGIGISNVRKRVEILGGEGAYLKYRARAGGGCVATIRFPLLGNRGKQ